MSADFDPFAEAFTFWAETANPKRYEQLLGDVVPQRVGRVLDVGCGPGFLSAWLADRAGHVTGLDISAAMIRSARRRAAAAGVRNTDYVVGDAEHPPFGTGSFDLIVSDATIHDTAMERSVPAIRALLKPGGKAILRDVITHDPKRARSPFWQLLGTLRNVPGYVGRLGVATSLRVLRFEASPTWIRHRARGGELTPAAFEETFARYLPGCRFRREPWFMTAIWESPR